jgi:DDE superfamily endonuclease
MATCFLNNVYCCYLPAHCSHGLQPLDNGIFNAVKAAYRKELGKLASLTDSAPVDKVNFIRAYAKAREVGMTKKNILASWRVTGNWPISRVKALKHPEIQNDKLDISPNPEPSSPYRGPDDTPKTSRQIRDLGKNKTPTTRRQYSIIAKGFEAKEQALAADSVTIASLKEEVARLKRGKTRRAIPNPNKRFISLSEALTGGKPTPKARDQHQKEPIVVDSESEGEVGEEEGSEVEVALGIENLAVSKSPQRTTRHGRIIKRPVKL